MNIKLIKKLMVLVLCLSCDVFAGIPCSRPARVSPSDTTRPPHAGSLPVHGSQVPPRQNGINFAEAQQRRQQRRAEQLQQQQAENQRLAAIIMARQQLTIARLQADRERPLAAIEARIRELEAMRQLGDNQV